MTDIDQLISRIHDIAHLTDRADATVDQQWASLRSLLESPCHTTIDLTQTADHQ